jgi:nucleoside-diphosphate-sugar epimerase
MKILVTGGAGFIGTYLIPSLVERGAEVVALDLSAAPAALAPVMDRITYVRADLGQSDDICSPPAKSCRRTRRPTTIPRPDGSSAGGPTTPSRPRWPSI